MEIPTLLETGTLVGQVLEVVVEVVEDGLLFIKHHGPLSVGPQQQPF